jgi:hypothetical protein
MTIPVILSQLSQLNDQIHNPEQIRIENRRCEFGIVDKYDTQL